MLKVLLWKLNRLWILKLVLIRITKFPIKPSLVLFMIICERMERLFLLKRSKHSPKTYRIAPFGLPKAAISDISECSWNGPFVTFMLLWGCLEGYNWTVTACADSIREKGTDDRCVYYELSIIDIISELSMILRTKEELKERLGGEYECLPPVEDVVPLGVNFYEMQKYRRK